MVASQTAVLNSRSAGNLVVKYDPRDLKADHEAGSNSESLGLEALDNVVLTMMADPRATSPRLERPVLLLPPPGIMTGGTPPPHSIFTGSGTPVSSARKRSAASGLLSSSPVKKPRTDKKSNAVFTYSFELPAATPPEIKRALAVIMDKAKLQDKAPFRLAYPWGGRRAWYDTAEHPTFHRAHCRL